MSEFAKDAARIDNETHDVLKAGLAGDGFELNKVFDKVNRSDWEAIRDNINDQNAKAPDKLPQLIISTLRDEMLLVDVDFKSASGKETLILGRTLNNIVPNAPDIEPPIIARAPKV